MLAFLALTCTALLAGTADAGVPVGDFTPHGTQPGLTFELEAPQSCQGCHGANFAPEDTFVPHTTWSGSIMANATRDPLFWAALDVAEHDVPGVGDWCLRCHTPNGWLAGRVRKNGAGGVVNGTNGCMLRGDQNDDDDENSDYAGVTCHLCHRMTERGPMGQVSAQLGNGNFWLNDTSPCGKSFGPCRYGPYSYTLDDDRAPPHAWSYSSFTTGSAHCGTCHDVSSPAVNGTPLRRLVLQDGTPTARAFPAERTFTEWKQSGFEQLFADSLEAGATAPPQIASRQNCQDCHMRMTTSPDARACLLNSAGSRANELPVHEFVGGGVWVLRVLKGLYGSAAQLDRIAAFDRTIAWSLELLQQRTADVDVTLLPWAGGTAPLSTRVRVTNNSGHKLPTGYGEGRRMWLNVVVRDAGNTLVYESGAWNASTGVLATGAQIKVYETSQGIWNAQSSTCKTTDAKGREQFHFVLNDCIAKDNRIPPAGMRIKSQEDPQGLDLRPVAYTYPESAPGSGILVNYDDTNYSIPIPAGAVPPLTVTATLQYQTSSKEYIEFLRDQATDLAIPSENNLCGRSSSVGPANKSRGQFVFDLWNGASYGKSPPVAVATDVAATP